MQKILIIGGTGFVGPNLAQAFLRAGCDVTVGSRRGPNGLSDWARRALKDVNVIHLNMTDPYALLEAMKGVDIVVHAASASKSRSSFATLEADLDVNLRGTLRVMQSAATAGVKRMVFISTAGAIYGLGTDLPYNETHKCTPISSYGVSKLASEGYVTLLGRQFGMSTLILRVSNPVGPGQTGEDGQGIVAVFARCLKQGVPVKVFGDGLARRDYVDIGEAMQAVSELTLNGETGIFNIGSGRSYSVSQVVDAFQGAIGRPVPTEFIALDTAADAGDIRIDISKQTEALQWVPKKELNEIVKDYLAWFEAEFDNIHFDA